MSQQDQTSPPPASHGPRISRRVAASSEAAARQRGVLEPFRDSVVRGAGGVRLYRAGDAALGCLGRQRHDPDHQRRLCSRRAHAAEQPGRRRGDYGRRARISSASRPAICWCRSIPPTTQAQVAQAEAGVAAAQAALDNLSQPGRAAIRHDRAGRSRSRYPRRPRRSRRARSRSASSRCRRPKPARGKSSNRRPRRYAKAQADVRASRAVIAAQRHQLEVLPGTKKQRAADLAGRQGDAGRGQAQARLHQDRGAVRWRRRRARRCSRAITSISAPTSSTSCRCRTSM